jgi:hypothetical protein
LAGRGIELDGHLNLVAGLYARTLAHLRFRPGRNSRPMRAARVRQV